MGEQTRANSDLVVMNHQVGDMVQGRAAIDTLLENPASGAS